MAGASAHGFYCEAVINVSLTLCHAVDESWSNTGSVIFSKAQMQCEISQTSLSFHFGVGRSMKRRSVPAASIELSVSTRLRDLGLNCDNSYGIYVLTIKRILLTVLPVNNARDIPES